MSGDTQSWSRKLNRLKFSVLNRTRPWVMLIAYQSTKVHRVYIYIVDIY